MRSCGDDGQDQVQVKTSLSASCSHRRLAPCSMRCRTSSSEIVPPRASEKQFCRPTTSLNERFRRREDRCRQRTSRISFHVGARAECPWKRCDLHSSQNEAGYPPPKRPALRENNGRPEILTCTGKFCDENSRIWRLKIFSVPSLASCFRRNIGLLPTQTQLGPTVLELLPLICSVLLGDKRDSPG